MRINLVFVREYFFQFSVGTVCCRASQDQFRDNISCETILFQYLHSVRSFFFLVFSLFLFEVFHSRIWSDKYGNCYTRKISSCNIYVLYVLSSSLFFLSLSLSFSLLCSIHVLEVVRRQLLHREIFSIIV